METGANRIMIPIIYPTQCSDRLPIFALNHVFVWNAGINVRET